MADAHLYGVRAPKNKHKEISSSTSLAFSSHLSSLISKEVTSASTTSHPSRPSSKSKPDLFTSHKERQSKKRTHAESEAPGNVGQKHKTEEELGGGADSSDLHRSRRKMEEKARLYAAMKRGDYVPPADGRGRDEQGTALIDFDRKWAEREARGEDHDNLDTSSGSEDGQSADEKEELIDYTDELGRTRQLPRSAIARLERERRIAANFATEAESMSVRPSMPTNIIYGDTVQHQAFNPDDDTAQKMATLAEKRDREATPPDDTHYDASKEIRNKGTGFYAFSGDKEGRQKEMEALEQERRETERRRKERDKEKEERRKLIEERKRKVAEARGKKQADQFLDRLGFDVGSGDGAEDGKNVEEHS